ncbi:MAG: YbhB/YbcL family Raf kinase inhibitor-like protein [Halanaeroarchaeum sp.]
MASTVLNGDVEQHGDLSVSSSDFEEGGSLPDWTGYANENENPELQLSGVPDDAESLVIVLDDPEARPVGGHTWDHWLVWDVDADVGTIPRDWDAEGTVGYTDYMEQGYGGPSPPEGSHDYRFKVLALDSTLDIPETTRKTRVGSAIAMNAEVLAATQIEASYHADQGTAF